MVQIARRDLDGLTRVVAIGAAAIVTPVTDLKALRFGRDLATPIGPVPCQNA